MANRWGNSDRLFFSAPKSLQVVTAVMKLKDAYSLELPTDLLENLAVEDGAQGRAVSRGLLLCSPRPLRL